MNSLTIALLGLAFIANGEQLADPGTPANPDLTFLGASHAAYWAAGSKSVARAFINRRLLLEKVFLLNQKRKLKGIRRPTDKVKSLLQIIDAELRIVERQLEREDSLRLDLANLF